MLFENELDIRRHTGYYLPAVGIRYSNVQIDARNFFDQPIRNNTKTHANIRNIAIGQGHDYVISSLLDSPFLKAN